MNRLLPLLIFVFIFSCKKDKLEPNTPSPTIIDSLDHFSSLMVGEYRFDSEAERKISLHPYTNTYEYFDSVLIGSTWTYDSFPIYHYDSTQVFWDSIQLTNYSATELGNFIPFKASYGLLDAHWGPMSRLSYYYDKNILKTAINNSQVSNNTLYNLIRVSKNELRLVNKTTSDTTTFLLSNYLPSPYTQNKDKIVYYKVYTDLYGSLGNQIITNHYGEMATLKFPSFGYSHNYFEHKCLIYSISHKSLVIADGYFSGVGETGDDGSGSGPSYQGSYGADIRIKQTKLIPN